MPRNVPIKVHLISKSTPIKDGIRGWLDEVGAENYDPFEGEPTDAEIVCGLPAKRCYMSFEPGLNPNVTKVRKEWSKYWDNVLKSGHGSVLEHYTYSFAVEGISRVFTGELNRHRAGCAISEGSMRYIRFDDIGWWMPLSIQKGNCFPDATDTEQKQRTREIFNEVFQFVEDKYKELCGVWDIENMKNFSQKKKLTSMFRRIVPMGVATGGVWSFNIRALRHIIAMRASEHAEEEICYVFSQIAKKIVEIEPSLFGDFEETEEGFWVPRYNKV